MRLDHMTDDERISIHAPRKGERPASAYCVMCPPYFNPRSPQGGATFPPSFFTSAVAVFQSTLPARGSDFGAGGCLHGRPLFQSTLPARGSDEELNNSDAAVSKISIHAPRKGERRRVRRGEKRLLDFNPRSPQGGATRPNPWQNTSQFLFQSTLPARGSDLIARLPPLGMAYNFNPRSPQGGATNVYV